MWSSVKFNAFVWRKKKKGKQRSSGVIVAQSTFSSSSEIMKNGGVQRVS